MAVTRRAVAQLAELEMQRLQLQMQLLEHRLTNLAVAQSDRGHRRDGRSGKAEGRTVDYRAVAV